MDDFKPELAFGFAIIEGPSCVAFGSDANNATAGFLCSGTELCGHPDSSHMFPDTAEKRSKLKFSVLMAK